MSFYKNIQKHMTKLEQQLQKIKQTKKIGLMTHVIVGYPSLEETVSLVETMAENGADIIELQIPFSDPLADGPTIMRACEQSLANGTKVKDAFTIMQTLSQRVSVPLLFMAYYNTVFRYGVEKFCKDARDAGVAGLIVPDMALEEESEEHFLKYCKQYGLHTIQVISPASTDDRLKKNAAIASGFVYCTARQGITGAKENLSSDLSDFLQRVRKFFPIPIAVGFGISKKDHVEALIGHSDIAVIGSALLDIINKTKKEKREESVKEFLASVSF
jgi:tryptophan synthase alpha chain